MFLWSVNQRQIDTLMYLICKSTLPALDLREDEPRIMSHRGGWSPDYSRLKQNNWIVSVKPPV
jgi:hypothetical protein